MKKTEALRQAAETRRRQDAMKATKLSLKGALDRIAELETHIEAFHELANAESTAVITPRLSKGRSEAVAVAIATDWHVGSVVKAETVNGMNAYNLAIARQRAGRFFQNLVKLTDKERQDVSITELVLFLGGDLIDGALHLDGIMSQDVSGPINQAVVCMDMLEAGLKYIEENGKFKQVTVVCADGNHSRLTQKQHHGSRKGNALEYFMYYTLAARFPQFKWVIADGLLTYLDIYDKTVRFMHGDTISFGGVNGPYTYLNRRIYQWNQGRYAHYTCLGHLHSYLPGRQWLINGSLVGYSPYAMSLGGEYQPPIQAFFLIDKARGITVHIPILV